VTETHTPARPVLPTEQRDYVSLREFEQRLSELRGLLDERTRYEREILSTRENLLKEAKELQAKEYERRLTELNHAHESAMENWRTSLPREVFDAHLTEFRTWRDSVNTSMTGGAQLPSAIGALDKRLEATEVALQQATGALVLIRFMGFAGVLALVVTFLRLAKVLP
jgi:DNA repair exonuclease SbcCD ATPase subunit